jgi:exopolyphosphatase/guanosine-5'-triphosphate,3'-diphosphate pyrophosphatase
MNLLLKQKKWQAFTITVIDGNEEADLIYYGNRMAVNMTNESISLIMDIGGGSTEFILGNDDTIFWKQSFLLGAARLLEKFKLSDPITFDETVDFLMPIFKTRIRIPLFEAIKLHQPMN